jgi:N-acetylglucosaminyldiphosphoundecaprenol N-acetyl-beta-D-mannosaminyltransferase
VLGMPIDAIDMASALHAIQRAAADSSPFLLSTPNLNFLVNSQLDPAFRETLLLSELCLADGMPIVWIARLLGLPIARRVAGSDVFATLKTQNNSARQLKLFLFGGAEGVAAAAAEAVNRSSRALCCVGWRYPGYGTVEELSCDHHIDEINKSRADFLIVALGAIKGQFWLQRNQQRLQIPIRAHLGATLSFEAGRFSRAPSAFRKLGLEWLWRIKEEPYLWQRYWNDGAAFIRLLVTHVGPLAIQARWQALLGRSRHDLAIECAADGDTTILHLSGSATAWNVEKAVAVLREALATQRGLRINLAGTRVIDCRFLGLLLMLRKRTMKQGSSLELVGAPPALRTMFRLNGAEFLLDPVRAG